MFKYTYCINTQLCIMFYNETIFIVFLSFGLLGNTMLKQSSHNDHYLAEEGT